METRYSATSGPIAEARSFTFEDSFPDDEPRQKPVITSTTTTSSPHHSSIPIVRSHSPGRLKFEQEHTEENTTIHMRTNFGKGYLPPTPSPRRSVPQDDESVPFDQKQNPGTQIDTTQLAHFARQPSFGDTTKPFDEEDQSRANFSKPFDEPSTIQPIMREDQDYFRMPAARSSAPTTYPYEDDLPFGATRVIDTQKAYGQYNPQREDEDSVFDFNKEDLTKLGKPRVSRRDKQKKPNYDDPDDTSLDKDYGAVTPPTNLQERSQAAWKLKQKKQGKKAQQQPDTTSRSPGVSFGNTDTVHHFTRDDNTLDNTLDNTYDDETLGDRSLNSFYTKSMESEVEDAIKDIFLIGKGENHAPGRRRVRDNPRVKEKLMAYKEEEEEEDDGTLETETRLEEASESTGPSRRKDEKKEVVRKQRRKQSRSKTSNEEKKEEIDEDFGDPVAEAWTFVESSLAAVGKALGYEEEADGEEESQSQSNDRSSKSTKKSESFDLFGHVSDMFMGPNSPCSNPHNRLDESRKVEIARPSIEDDIRLIDLATQAAKSAHKLQGYEFNQSYEIDIVNDIAFSVIDLKLPLGIIFQEHDHGCWVTKILPEGSAYASKKVSVGDQLAAIGGKSAIDMRVEDVSDEIKNKKRKFVELTFLRYVGPIKPAAGRLKEEGYEISAKPKPKAKNPVNGETYQQPYQPTYPQTYQKSENPRIVENIQILKFSEEKSAPQIEQRVPLSKPERKPDPAEDIPNSSRARALQAKQKAAREQEQVDAKADKKKFGFFRRRR